MTVMEALQWANEKLKHDAIGDSPMLDAQVLLAHAMEVSKSWLFTHLGEPLRAPQEDAFRKLIERRAAHEPVAYMVGEREFYGRPFTVNRFVLIPRPATETLVEAALPLSTDALFADIGTGSGAIAVTLAAESGTPVIATDYGREAITVAKLNAERNGVADLVDVRQGDLLDPLIKLFEKITKPGAPLPYKRLVICANLPYLTQAQWEAADRDVKDFEPKTALVGGGPDGLELYWKLFRQLSRARQNFPRKLTVLVEIDPDQTNRITALITHDFPGSTPHVLKDLEGFDRVVIADI